nr:50S ribosomal protein L24 [Nevskia sp.]
MMRKIKKGDEIIVITGKDKGRRGTVSVVQDDGKIIVEGLNLAKKHQKGNPQAGVSGGIVEKEMPLDASNVMLFNAKTGKGDRVGFKFLGEGEARRKVRFFKSNQEVLDA